MKWYAYEILPESRINVNKYTFMYDFCRPCIHLKKDEMYNRYEAHKVYFQNACVKYDITCLDE